MSDEYTVAEIEEGIVKALAAADVNAVEALLTMMARQDPNRAFEIANTMKTGIAIRKGRT